MIDKKGRLFGKINIIDLLIILIIIAAVIFFVRRSAAPAQGGGETTATETVSVSFTSDEAPYYFADSLEEGGRVYEDTTNIELGKVTSFTSEPAYSYEVDAEGNTVKVPSPYDSLVTVTADVQGELRDNGVYVGGKAFCVGKTYIMHFGKTCMSCRISAIDAK